MMKKYRIYCGRAYESSLKFQPKSRDFRNNDNEGNMRGTKCLDTPIAVTITFINDGKLLQYTII